MRCLSAMSIWFTDIFHEISDVLNTRVIWYLVPAVAVIEASSSLINTYLYECFIRQQQFHRIPVRNSSEWCWGTSVSNLRKWTTLRYSDFLWALRKDRTSYRLLRPGKKMFLYPLSIIAISSLHNCSLTYEYNSYLDTETIIPPRTNKCVILLEIQQTSPSVMSAPVHCSYSVQCTSALYFKH
jgi:hypothetical protein